MVAREAMLQEEFRVILSTLDEARSNRSAFENTREEKALPRIGGSEWVQLDAFVQDKLTAKQAFLLKNPKFQYSPSDCDMGVTRVGTALEAGDLASDVAEDLAPEAGDLAPEAEDLAPEAEDLASEAGDLAPAPSKRKADVILQPVAMGKKPRL